jgi:hypothetical protein
MIRAGEDWNSPELDGYRLDNVVVLDIEPDGAQHAG